MACLAILTTTRRAWIVDAEVVGVKEEGVAIGDVELLFVAEELLAFLGEGGLEAEADGIGESFVLFLGLVEFLLGQALKLGNGGVVVALRIIPSARRLHVSR